MLSVQGPWTYEFIVLRGALGTALLSAEENINFKSPANAVAFQFQQTMKKTIQKEVNVLFVIQRTKSRRKKTF